MRIFPCCFPAHVSAVNSGEVEYVSANAYARSVDQRRHDVVWHGSVLPSADATARQTAVRRRTPRTYAPSSSNGELDPLPEGRTEPWKIAVLVRNRNHLTDIVAALKKDNGQAAIPFRAVDIEPLGERREVLDLFALTRALLHPADRVAWLAVLHAPWCGLGAG